MKIVNIGSGVYSLALAHALSKNDNEINIWTHNDNIYKKYKESGNLKSIIDLEFSEKISISTDLNTLCNEAELIFIVTTSEYFDNVIDKMKNFYNGCPVCIATKGMDDKSVRFLSDIAKEKLNSTNISVISGPSFAIDIINDDFVSLSVASFDSSVSQLISDAISSYNLIIEDCNDVIGLQVCNSIKNVVAIASGVFSGLGYSNSTNAFLITKVINDLEDLLPKLGAKKSTVFSAAGIGDMILTCTSIKSRNYKFGLDYALNLVDENYLKNTTVEGYFAINTFKKILEVNNVSFQLVDLLYSIINENADINLIKDYLK